MRLPAGHRDSVVEQNFVGDVDLCGERKTDRQRPRMIVGAVAEVLEHVAASRKRRLADPVGALAAHLREPLGGAIHPLHHVVAADAGVGAGAFRHFRRRIVRTTGAEIRRALRRLLRFREPRLRLSQLRNLLRDGAVGWMKFQQPFADGDGDVVGVERAFHRKQPFALFVALADDNGLIRRSVKLLTHLHFDERTLLLDDDDELEPARELLQTLRFDRPCAAQFVEPQPQIVGARLVDVEIVQRLPHIKVGLADGDDPDRRMGSARHDRAIDLVGPQKRHDGVALVILQPRLLRQHGITRTDIEPVGRQLVICGHDGRHAVDRSVDRRG